MIKIKVAILGVGGKVGKEILERISEIVGLKREIGIKATNNLYNAIQNADVIIDFSSKEITNELIDNANEFLKNRKLIIGVTGFDEDFNEKLLNVSKNHVIFQSSNMTFGMSFLSQFIEKSILSLTIISYKASINETHHIGKKDAPSGTAKILRGMIKEFTGDDIEIFSTREGESNSIHEVKFDGIYDSISLRHEVKDKEVFADTSLKVVEWIYGKNIKGLYHMSDYLSSVVSDEVQLSSQEGLKKRALSI
jgi:4-hydroxy-tetrahydrodipicolinate reductase